MKSRIAVALSLTLLATLLGPVAGSSASMVSKTFTVTKSDGTPYPNVDVALIGWTDEDGDTTTPPVRTNASGEVTIQVDGNAEFYGYAIQPIQGDYTHAPIFFDGLVRQASEEISVRLKPANTKFVVQTFDSQPADAAWLSYPSTGMIGQQRSWIKLLRSGPFALDLSTSLSTTGRFQIEVMPDNLPGNFTNVIGFSHSRNNNSSSYSFFTDRTNSTPLTPITLQGESVIPLRFASPNFSGNLRSSSGQTLTLNGPFNGSISVYRANSLGQLDASEANLASYGEPLSEAGSFQLRLMNNEAGKYFPLFRIAGSHTVPSFVGPAFFVDGNGNYSLNENGPFVSPASFVYSTNAPSTANALRLQAQHPTTNQPLEVDIQVEESSQFGSIWYGPGIVQNGLASYSLRDGAYNLWVNPRNQALAPIQVSLIVDAGEYILRTQTGQLLTPNNNGVYVVSPAVPNVSFRIVNPDDPTQSLNAGVQIFNNLTDRHVASGWPINGLVVFNLPNGEYRANVEVSQGRFAPRDYLVVVSNQGVSVRDYETETLLSPSGGVYGLRPHTANVILSLVDAEGSPIIPGNSVWANGRIERFEGGNWDHVTHINIASDGSMAFRASETGDYRINIEIQGRPALAGRVVEFEVTDVNGVLDLEEISLPESNFQFKILNPEDGLPIRHSQLILIKQVNGNFDGERRHVSSGNLAHAGLLIEEAGTYKLIAERSYELPANQFASKSYIMQVDSIDSGYSISVSDGDDPIEIVSGVYQLELARPNVTGNLVDSSGDPIDTMTGWVDISVQKYDAGRNQWDWTDYGTSLGNDSSFGFYIQEFGEYRIVFYPYGIENASTTYTDSFEVDPSNRDETVRAFGEVTFATPTAKLAAVHPTTNARVFYSNIDVMKEDNNGDFQWFESIYTGRLGIANFSANSTGTYRFTVHPSWRGDSDTVSKSYIGEVTGSPGNYSLSIEGVSATNGVLGLPLGTPNIRATILASDGSAVELVNGRWLDVNVQQYDAQEDRWNWTNNPITVKNNGSIGGVVSTPGTYRLRISPFGFINQSLTFSSNFTITQANASTFSRDFGNIRLAPPTISGEVLGPEGNQRIANAQVVPVNAITGQELWEYSQTTSADGKWSLLLPPGSYSIFARAPWGSADFGNSAPIANVVVNASGVASINGTPTNSGVLIRLTNPTWSGTLVNPIEPEETLAFVSVCLWHLEGNDSTSICTQSNGEGRWALSKPANFSGFNDSSTLTIHPDRSLGLAERRYQGAAAIGSVLPFDPANASAIYEDIELSPAEPNVEITVLKPDEEGPAANVWVNLSSPNGWLGGGVTNQQGVAKIFVSDYSGPVDIEAYVSGVQALRDDYSNTRESLNSVTINENSVLQLSVELATPNLRAIVYKPGNTPSSNDGPIHRSWVEVYDETNNRWSGGVESNALGEVALSLPPQNNSTTRYRITVNPPFANPELLSRVTYIVDVDSEGNLDVTDLNDTTVVETAGRFAFVLAKPSVTGTVSTPDESAFVRDSWVVPLDYTTRFELWQFGSNSNQLGEFGIALPDGSYYLVANAPWQNNNFAKSEQCRVDISGGVLITQNSNCVEDGRVNLKLREPNLRFRFVHEGSPVQFAHVGFSVGSWHTHASSNRNGEVAVFIDPVEIASQNPGMTGSQKIHVHVHPSGNQSGIVGWQCKSNDPKPLCEDLPDLVIGQPYLGGVTTVLDDVVFMTPNTSVTVLDPVTEEEKAYAWVEIFKEEQGWLRWIAGSNSNLSGLAEFNLEDSLIENPDSRFTVYVNPPWGNRSNLARSVYRNLSYADLNGATFELSEPNLKIRVNQALSSTGSRWGWVSVQKQQVQDQNSYWDWYGGFGLDEFGFTSLALEKSSVFRITAHPGPGSAGSAVTCEFETDVAGEVAFYSPCLAGEPIVDELVVLGLSAGNVQGRVVRPGGTVGLPGAIVFAEAFDDNNQIVSGMTAEVVTNQAGEFGLQLSDQYRWEIKVFYVNPPGAAVRLASRLTPISITRQQLLDAASDNEWVELEAIELSTR